MAVIDLKNTTFRLYDGKDLDATGIIAINQTAAEADFSVQAKIMASPDAPITLTLVEPGVDAALSVVVTERAIVVNLAEATAVITTTATLLKAAIEGNAAANALVTITLDEAGTGICEGLAITTITNPSSIAVTIGEGTFTYSEKRPVEFKLNRGVLNEVREADQEPIDVSFDFSWDYITAATGASVPSVEDALKRLGAAAAWYNASSDPCRPLCVNVSIMNNPTCATVQKEVTEITEFYQEALDHDPDAGQVACSGRANNQYATNVRIT